MSFPRRFVRLDGDAVSAFCSAAVKSASTSSAILTESSFAFLSASDNGTKPCSEPTPSGLFFPNLCATFALPDASLSSVDLVSAPVGIWIAARPSASYIVASIVFSIDIGLPLPAFFCSAAMKSLSESILLRTSP